MTVRRSTTLRALTVVPPVPFPAAVEEDDVLHVTTVPVPRDEDGGSSAPWRTDGDVAWVPAALLLAASGRCSCDDCCAALARRQRRAVLSAV